MSLVSKPGKYGTLYLFEITYRSDTDTEGREPLKGRWWGYDIDHAEERFYDSDPDAGWVALSARRVQEGR